MFIASECSSLSATKKNKSLRSIDQKGQNELSPQLERDGLKCTNGWYLSDTILGKTLKSNYLNRPKPSLRAEYGWQ